MPRVKFLFSTISICLSLNGPLVLKAYTQSPEENRQLLYPIVAKLPEELKAGLVNQQSPGAKALLVVLLFHALENFHSDTDFSGDFKRLRALLAESVALGLNGQSAEIDEFLRGLEAHILWPAATLSAEERSEWLRKLSLSYQQSDERIRHDLHAQYLELSYHFSRLYDLYLFNRQPYRDIFFEAYNNFKLAPVQLEDPIMLEDLDTRALLDASLILEESARELQEVLDMIHEDLSRNRLVHNSIREHLHLKIEAAAKYLESLKLRPEQGGQGAYDIAGDAYSYLHQGNFFHVSHPDDRFLQIMESLSQQIKAEGPRSKLKSLLGDYQSSYLLMTLEKHLKQNWDQLEGLYNDHSRHNSPEDLSNTLRLFLDFDESLRDYSAYRRFILQQPDYGSAILSKSSIDESYYLKTRQHIEKLAALVPPEAHSQIEKLLGSDNFFEKIDRRSRDLRDSLIQIITEIQVEVKAQHQQLTKSSVTRNIGLNHTESLSSQSMVDFYNLLGRFNKSFAEPHMNTVSHRDNLIALRMQLMKYIATSAHTMENLGDRHPLHLVLARITEAVDESLRHFYQVLQRSLHPFWQQRSADGTRPVTRGSLHTLIDKTIERTQNFEHRAQQSKKCLQIIRQKNKGGV